MRLIRWHSPNCSLRHRALQLVVFDLDYRQSVTAYTPGIKTSAMSYNPRIECQDVASFQTTRARNSELWFVNNHQLEEAILGYAALYSTRYEVKMYALAIEGNHIQKVAQFPKANRAHFMRDFNSAVARSVARYQSNYKGGTLWARRYS